MIARYQCYTGMCTTVSFACLYKIACMSIWFEIQIRCLNPVDKDTAATKLIRIKAVGFQLLFVTKFELMEF